MEEEVNKMLVSGIKVGDRKEGEMTPGRACGFNELVARMWCSGLFIQAKKAYLSSSFSFFVSEKW